LPEESEVLQAISERLGRVIERLRAEDGLKESEQKFRSTFEQAAVGIAHITPDGRFLRVNQKLCDILGYAPEELLGITFMDITHPDDREEDLALEPALAGGLSSYVTDKRYIHRNGSTVWVRVTVSLVGGSRGRPQYFLSVYNGSDPDKPGGQCPRRHAPGRQANRHDR
jgi:two-component system sensor histidine kinase UhpB